MSGIGSPATQKQIDYILSLAGKAYLSQADKEYSLGMSNREMQGGLTKAEASRYISRLLEIKRSERDA